MSDESTVYGYIKNNSADNERQNYLRHAENRQAVKGLPSMDCCSLLNQEYFSIPAIHNYDEQPSSTIIHFGKVYRGVEYEWSVWISEFEQLLKKMYWNKVVVHLETEVSGVHTFSWESGDEVHSPNDSTLNIRCEWQHELGISSCYA
ncbi:MAG: hypothetical protein ACJATV_001670 [Granulosicoccus sp.]|jgi:hypothetical protein